MNKTLFVAILVILCVIPAFANILPLRAVQKNKLLARLQGRLVHLIDTN
jgi:hypothetical protein